MSIQRDRIAALNDTLRRNFSTGHVIMTRGIAGLGDETISRIVRAVSEFDDFNESNDPWQEHDAGGFELDGQEFFWKIDYFGLDLLMHSPDPADPCVTKRVLTIMDANEV